MNFMTGNNTTGTRKKAQMLCASQYKISAIVVSRFCHNPLDEISFNASRIAVFAGMKTGLAGAINFGSRKMPKLNSNRIRT